jgi:hypothetical protein
MVSQVQYEKISLMTSVNNGNDVNSGDGAAGNDDNEHRGVSSIHFVHVHAVAIAGATAVIVAAAALDCMIAFVSAAVVIATVA